MEVLQVVAGHGSTGLNGGAGTFAELPSDSCPEPPKPYELHGLLVSLSRVSVFFGRGFLRVSMGLYSGTRVTDEEATGLCNL